MLMMGIERPGKGHPEMQLAGNTATGMLKLIALFFMFCDHAGKMLFPAIPELRMLGRIAYPLYAWCAVVGFEYTRSVPRYLMRLWVVGLFSQLVYMPALAHHWNEPNVFLTLILGISALYGLREKKYGSQFWAPAASIILAVLLKADYGWKGVLFIILLYSCRGSRASIAAVMVAYCMFWGQNTRAVTEAFGLKFVFDDAPLLANLTQPWLKLQALSIFALPFILIRPKQDVTLPKWAGYSLYPAHLLLLIILEFAMKKLTWAMLIERFL